ncbi:MAG TPA: MBG domain-containing protein [Micropepsaceae bacterium]|nr:MBG domain-containing protein [Micropepsaceae bacterium]
MVGGKSRIVCGLTVSAGGLVFVLTLGIPVARGASPVLPSGASVGAGSVSIASPSETSTVILQSSKKAIINWQSFSVGAGSKVVFQQPDSAAITLNRVVGSGASAIDGTISANGQVWLVNRNGVFFGQGSQIDIGGLIATTSDIRDPDFLAGNYNFGTASPNPNAGVVNKGTINTAPGGSAVLSAAHVANEGVIQANLGRVVLGGANAFSVDFDGDNLIRYAVTAPVSETPQSDDGSPVPGLVSNSGTITAQGGKVLMTARAARNVVDNVINTTGIVEATTASLQNGEIVLDAGDGGTVNVAGSLVASGNGAGETGGRIAVTADKITVADGARLSVSGESGGGAVLIGGALHGAGPEPNANSVTVGNANIAANAVSSGQGGTVTVYSSGETKFAASISAKGGATGGDGGTVETSGHDLQIADTAHADTSASAGKTGVWLIDPQDVTVDAVFAKKVTDALALTNVLVEASNDVTVTSPVIYGSAHSLGLLAEHNVTLDASVQNSGAGSVLAVGGWDGVTLPENVLSTAASFGNNGGSVFIGGPLAVGNVAFGSQSGTVSIAARDLSVSAVNGFAQVGFNGAGGGNIVAEMTGNVALTGGGNFAGIGNGANAATPNASGNINIMASGSVTVSSAQIGNNAASIAGTVLVSAEGDLILGGGASIYANSGGDALVLAAGGDFVNQAGGTALNVGGGGRWLAFLNDPASNNAAGLNASPFYNRVFDFASSSYAAITSAGNRFVYALAPVLTVTADSKTRAYGDANPALTATITGLVGNDALANAVTGQPALSTNAGIGSNIGDYAILAGPGSLASDFNYGFQFANGNLHIDPAALTVTVDNKAREYGLANPPLTASITGFRNNDSADVVSGLTLSTSATIGSNVGNYAITSSGGTAQNYTITTRNDGTLSVTPAGLTVTVDDKTREYGLANPSLTANITGFRNNDSANVVSGLTLSTSADTGSNVGAYAITSSGGTAQNYTITTRNDGTLSVTPAGLTVTVDDKTREYGLVNPTLTATITGLRNNDKAAVVSGLNISTSANTGSNVGAYVITSSGGAAQNYVITARNDGTLSVTPAPLTASLVGTVQKTYDGTTTANVTGANFQLSGVLPGDNVALGAAANGNYDSRIVGSGKLVTVNGLALTGASQGNYVLVSNSASATIGVINAAALIASLTGTVEKTSDGSNAATLTASNYQLSGAIAVDDVALNNPAAGSYDNPNAGTGKIVTVSGLALAGADQANYLLSSASVSGPVGVIRDNAVVIDNGVIRNLITGPTTPIALTIPPPAAVGAQDATDATSATSDADFALADMLTDEVAASLSGAEGTVRSATSVLIEGLLRQFAPPPGGLTPHAIPPFGQTYSSWGNEAFWQ